MGERPWQKQYDEGVPFSIDYPPVPLFFFLEDAAKKHPETPCTIFHGAKITYKEMNTDREFMKEFPKTPNQKIEKYKLREKGITPETWDREKAGIKVER